MALVADDGSAKFAASHHGPSRPVQAATSLSTGSNQHFHHYRHQRPGAQRKEIVRSVKLEVNGQGIWPRLAAATRTNPSRGAPRPASRGASVAPEDSNSIERRVSSVASRAYISASIRRALRGPACSYWTPRGTIQCRVAQVAPVRSVDHVRTSSPGGVPFEVKLQVTVPMLSPVSTLSCVARTPTPTRWRIATANRARGLTSGEDPVECAPGSNA
jgi:hypothetical protein